MKKIILFILLVTAGYTYGQQKQVVTKVFKVAGNCEQCKKRIENAADIKGVKNSKWDEEKQSLTVIYRSDKVTEQQIKDAVAKSGHDAEEVKAPNSKYAELPDCCKYRDKKCEVKK